MRKLRKHFIQYNVSCCSIRQRKVLLYFTVYNFKLINMLWLDGPSNMDPVRDPHNF